MAGIKGIANHFFEGSEGIITATVVRNAGIRDGHTFFFLNNIIVDFWITMWYNAFDIS